MIGKLTGFVDIETEDFIILNVNDVGYKVFCSTKVLNILHNNKDKINLLIETVVKEDSIALFGFNTIEEQECFNTLCKVSGVGPKVALKIMSISTPKEIITAIINNDSKVFCRTSGIGPKVAVRIIHELQNSQMVKGFDIIKNVNTVNSIEENEDNKKIINDAILALEGLGYQKNIVKNIVVKIIVDKPYLTLESLITESLKKINNF